MYALTYSKKGLNQEGKMFVIQNENGEISVVEVPYYKKAEDNMFFIEGVSDSGNKVYNGCTPSEFCKNPNLSMTFSGITDFRHLDKNILIDEWNNYLTNQKLNESTKIIYVDNNISGLHDLLEVIPCYYESFNVATINHNFSINIMESEDDWYDFYIDENFVEDENIQEFLNFAANYSYDEDDEDSDAIIGTISYTNLSRYIATFGGLDMSRTHFYEYTDDGDDWEDFEDEDMDDDMATLLTLESLFGDDEDDVILRNITTEKKDVQYCYTLYNNQIFAMEYTSEDDNYYYYYQDKRFAKMNNSNVEKFDITNCPKFYSSNLSELISIYNQNIDKFKVK